MPAVLRYSAAYRRSHAPEALDAAKAGGVVGLIAVLATMVLLAL
jgi:hypothetical protein